MVSVDFFINGIANFERFTVPNRILKYPSMGVHFAGYYMGIMGAREYISRFKGWMKVLGISFIRA